MFILQFQASSKDQFQNKYFQYLLQKIGINKKMFLKLSKSTSYKKSSSLEFCGEHLFEETAREMIFQNRSYTVRRS